jgi:hypothetical protein
MSVIKRSLDMRSHSLVRDEFNILMTVSELTDDQLNTQVDKMISQGRLDVLIILKNECDYRIKEKLDALHVQKMDEVNENNEG